MKNYKSFWGACLPSNHIGNFQCTLKTHPLYSQKLYQLLNSANQVTLDHIEIKILISRGKKNHTRDEQLRTAKKCRMFGKTLHCNIFKSHVLLSLLRQSSTEISANDENKKGFPLRCSRK